MKARSVAPVVLALFMSACGRSPTFALQGYFFLSQPNEALAAAENPKILQAVEGIVTAIAEQNPDKLLEYVDRKEGAITDAKAVVPYAQIATALHDPKAQLYRVLWDDQYWKETAPSDNVKSYRKIFRSAGEIRLGIFYYSAQECEVRLDFKDRPSMGIMANLVLRKREGKWFLMNFF